MTVNAANLPEFIFGQLSTPKGRLNRVNTLKLGLSHDFLPLDPKPNEPIKISVHVGAEVGVKSITLYYSTDGTIPDSLTANSLSMQRTEIQWDTLQWCYLETWSAEIPGQLQGTYVQYAIKAITNTGRDIGCPYVDEAALKSLGDSFDQTFLKRLENSPSPQIFGVYVDEESIPTWLQEAVIYQIFVERFAPDPGKSFVTPAERSGFYGGTLRGVIAKLDYLQELGVTCLWLTPIFPSPSHHGYDPVSHDTIEPRLGTEADWETLVNSAHQRGLRIILDYVANHISNEHPAFKAAQKEQNNPTYAWFRFREWPDSYDCFFDVPDQPEVNSDHPAVRAYFIEQASKWLKWGCDGFRLDYAHGVTHAFWSAFRAATRALKADSIMIGEITTSPDLVRSYAGRMDGCLDFKLLELLRGFFAFNTLTVSQFEKVLEQHFAYFGSGLVLPSFLDNHDMNRFLWVVKGDQRRLKLAALCQFTLPAPPIIYYGTEVGLSQLQAVGRLEESRLPMLWEEEEQDQSLLSFYRSLIAFRRQNPAIWSQRQSLIIDDERGVYGYSCGNYIIILNNSPQSVQLPFPNSVQLILTSDPSNSWHTETKELELGAFSGVIVGNNRLQAEV